MNRALAGSRQVLVLCSPDYFKDEAVYSLMEMMAAVWGDPDGNLARLVPVEIADCDYAPLARIIVSGKTPDAAAAALLARLADVEETKRREDLHTTEAGPEVFYVPRPRNPDFSGHFEALGTLHQTLSHGQRAAVTQAIAGLGGIGKTTLAAEYAHRFGTRGRYGGVWWVAAESESGIVQGLGDLAKKFGHPESNDLTEMARCALGEVTRQTPPWLVIYDNVPNAEGLRYRLPSGEIGSWLPQSSARVLITSRAANSTGLAEVTRLDEWDLSRTADYLLRVTGRDDRAGAEALAEKLGGLPMAADQAAAFLRERPGVSFKKYAEELEPLLNRTRDEGNKGDYSFTVYATLVRSLEALSPATQDLLCLLAWLSPDGVEEQLLTATAEDLPDRLGAALRDDIERADMIRPALGLSLLKADEGTDWGQVLTLHRVTQAVLRVWQRADGQAGWDVLAAQIVNGVFPYDPVTVPKDWPLCARLLPHARALAEHGPREGEGAKALGRVLNQAGVFLDTRGDTVGAIAMLEPNVKLIAAVYGEKPPTTPRRSPTSPAATPTPGG